MKKLILLSIFVLVACSPQPAGRYETTSTSRWNKATIEVNWLPNEESVSKKCLSLGTNDGPTDSVQKYNGCARSKPSEPTVCEVYAVEPQSFDDDARLNAFGHELWHCYGARHK